MNHSLVADIGGTNARIGLVAEGGGEIFGVEVFSNREFASLEDLLRHYMSKVTKDIRPYQASFAVASPVLGDDIQFTNNSWSFNISDLKNQLGLKKLYVLNDFEAIARSLPFLKGDALLPICAGRGQAVPQQTIGVVGPGTGFGTGAAVPDGKGSYVPMPSEGGHTAFAPQNDEEIFLQKALIRDFGFACNEDLLSGQGLENIYRILAERAERSDCRLSAKDICDRALQGKDEVAVDTLTRFCAILGSVAGDHALTVGARGGLYLAGGILPRFLEFFQKSPFRERFEAKGRYADYLIAIPTYVIIGTQPGLIGAASLVSDLRKPS